MLSVEELNRVLIIWNSRYSRANIVEVHGIPVTKNEHVLNVVQDLDKALNMNITESIIDACHQLRSRTGPESQPAGISQDFFSNWQGGHSTETLCKRTLLQGIWPFLNSQTSLSTSTLHGKTMYQQGRHRWCIINGFRKLSSLGINGGMRTSTH